MPLNVIIIAVLGLAVLIILIIMLATKSKTFSEADYCENQGGRCVVANTSCDDGFTKWTVKKCKATDTSGNPQDCCFPT